MTDYSILNWSTTASDNATADGEINWAEFQNPDTVNDSARKLMARVAERIADEAPKRASTGAANTYAVTLTSTPSALADGLEVAFVAHQDNTGASTLAVNSLGGKPLRSISNTALRNKEILSGQVVVAKYKLSTDEFLIVNGAPQLYSLYASLLSSNTFGLKVGDVKLSLASSPDAGFVRLTDSPQTLNKADYPDLNSWASGQGYPWGSASTTFNIPAAGGYFLRFGASGSSVDPGGPRTPGTTQTDLVKAHTHTGTTSTDAGHTHTAGYILATTPGGGSNSTIVSNAVGSQFTTGTSGSHNHTFTTDANTGAENRPVNVTMYADMLANPALVATGIVGVTGYAFKYSTGTSGDPGSGYLGFDTTTLASVNTLRISKTSSTGANLGTILAALTSGTGFYLTKVGAVSNFVYFALSGSWTDNTTYLSIAVTSVSASATLSNADNLTVAVTGAAGPTGSSGPGYAATSTTSLSIGSGSKTFTTQSGLAYVAGVRVRAADAANPSTNYMEGVVSSYSGTTLVVSMDNTVGSGTIASWNIGVAGDKGTTGSTGTSGTDPGIRWLFASSTTMADPSAGNIRFNNASLGSATAAAISYSCGETGNPSVANTVKAWDDSSTTAHRGYLIVKKVSAPQNYVVFDITGALTDNTTWAQLALTVVDSNGSFSASDVLSIQFSRTGDAGSGSLSGMSANGMMYATGAAAGTSTAAATDGQILIGKTGLAPALAALSGDVTMTNAGVTAIGSAKVTNAMLAGSIDLTTKVTGTLPVANGGTGITALGTGVATFLGTPSSANLLAALTDETGTGAAVFANTPTLVTPILGTPTSGTLTNCTGLPVAGITASTSTALGVGSIELGHASDTTLSRSSAGVLAVEGVTVSMNSTSATHTAGTIELGAASDTTLARSAAGVVTIEGNTILTNGQSATLSKGFPSTSYNIGTPTNGSTTTLDITNGHYQYLTNNVAGITIAAPSTDGGMVLLITNGASAGTVTFSGFTVGSSTGSALTTTNTNKFRVMIERINSVATYSIYALQ